MIHETYQHFLLQGLPKYSLSVFLYENMHSVERIEVNLLEFRLKHVEIHMYLCIYMYVGM
jgi:hypothetical protein